MFLNSGCKDTLFPKNITRKKKKTPKIKVSYGVLNTNIILFIFLTE